MTANFPRGGGANPFSAIRLVKIIHFTVVGRNDEMIGKMCHERIQKVSSGVGRRTGP